MKNYAEELKYIWKKKDLSFIATFKKVDNKHGYFIDFKNPVSKRRLYYPVINGVQVSDKRISFPYGNSLELKDGDLYTVDLAYTNSPKGKNNPYSLSIKKVILFKQTAIIELLSKKTIDDKYSGIIFYGRYLKKNERFVCFDNVMFAKTGAILMIDGQRLEVYVSPNINLEDEKYYSFNIREVKGKLPEVNEQTIKLLKINPYGNLVNEISQLTKNPKYDKIIAGMMREIGDGMYSSKQRMIFELLQNADDSAANSNLKFHVDTENSYLTVMHDGIPFNSNDVEAITSAGESTKQNDVKKTGYKGIGFKAVFTNCEEVVIRSGGYNFSFQRYNSSYENFDEYYIETGNNELLNNQRLLDRYRKSFDYAKDIPWQIIPIWTENLPEVLRETNFESKMNNVKFAMNYGKSNIPLYIEAIENLSNFPQFMLFLRNTSGFLSHATNTTIYKSKLKDGSISIVKKTLNNSEHFFYQKIILDKIQVSNQVFLEKNINLRICEEVNKLGDTINYFETTDGNRIDNVPTKLASLTQTEITFAIPIIDGMIKAEESYIENRLFSSLFTYLPMVEQRIQLPFMINGDFVPSSDREKIQGDNPWNIFLISNIADQHVKVLNYFSNLFKGDQFKHKHYLSLLLKKLHPITDSTFNKVTEVYNKVYSEQLKITSIVINDNNKNQLLSETIIDNSGFIELFGHEVFYEIIGTEKKLPHTNLDNSYLNDYNYLNIEAINLQQLAEKISPEICESLGKIIVQKSLYDNPELLAWLNKLVKYMPGYFGKIPFILHNKALFSLERLIDESDAWLINENTSQYQNLIDELGYHMINLNLDEYSNIKAYLTNLRGYVNDKNLAYERIASNSNLHRLAISSKLKLIDFLQNSNFMKLIGPAKYFGELKLFVDESNIPRPLFQLLSRKEDLEVNSIDNFRVKESEYNSIPDALTKELIAKDQIFTSFILDKDLFEEWSQHFDTETINSYVDDLKTIYSWEKAPKDIHPNKWPSIPWLFIDDETRFITSDKVYWSKAFNDLSADKFETIKSVLHSKEVKILPVQECGSLIKVFSLKTDDSSEIDWSEVEELEMLVANTLLDWMGDDGGFGDFFKNYTLVANNNNTYEINEIEDVKIFDGTDKALKIYIHSNNVLFSLFKELDKNLCSDNRSMIGLLQGDKLIKALIESSEYDQNLALHLSPNVSTDLLHSFINNLKEFKLFTASEFGGDTSEHIVVNNILNKIDESAGVSEEISDIINKLKTKTLVNGQPLTDFDTSNAISFGKEKIIKCLHLSDVLNEYEGESDVIEEILESFTQIRNKRKLRKFIFKTRILEPQEIHYEIEKEEQSFYSVEQVIFQLLDESFGNNRNWPKQHFDDYFKKQGSVKQLYSSYRKFLDILFKLSFTDLSNFYFYDLDLEECIDKNFAIESEHIPNWLEEWVNKDQIKRFEFLSKLGYNGIDSAIVNLRKSMIAKVYDQNLVIRYFEESKPNMQIIWNTILWLANYNPNIVTQNIQVIKQVNDFIPFESIDQITVPIIKSIDAEGQRAYYLQPVNSETKLLKIDTQSEFSDSIFNSLNSSLNNPDCVDQNIGELSDYLNITAVQLEESVDLKSLEFKSKLWEEPFYNKWEHRSDYHIYIYDGGEIPYHRTFNNITINIFTKDLRVANGSKFYVSRLFKSDPLDHLPDSFPKDKLNELKDWERRTIKEPSLIEDNPLEDKYNEIFDRMIQDRYGISEDRQNDENSNAKKQALYYLEAEGYEVNDGHSENDYAALYGIKDSDENNINFIVKSAKGGLLFLNKSHWEMLKSEETQLITIYPGNEPKIFKDRMELLEDEMQDKVLFRIPNNKNKQEIDGVFDNLESDSHLILVTSKKMKESLFDIIGKKGTFNKDEEANVMDDNIVIE
jgi:hypothetical protein